MEKGHAEKQASEESKRGGNRSLKKIKSEVKRIVRNLKRQKHRKYKKVRLMFQDEAGFGRINKPKQCWCKKGVRPSVPCHHIREYRYTYGAVEPLTGENFFLIMQRCNTENMNTFLKDLSEKYPEDYIILVCDGASWHKSQTIEVSRNMELIFIPPYTPEMNPIEQIWKEIRAKGFKNEAFDSLADVVDRLCETISNLTNEIVKSITGRKWILKCF